MEDEEEVDWVVEVWDVEDWDVEDCDVEDCVVEDCDVVLGAHELSPATFKE